MIRAFAVAIGVAVWVLLAPVLAHAKPRVAIVAFDGDNQGALQDIVTELLEGEVSVVGNRQVTRAMDKLELDSDMSAKQLKKLAKELETDSIIRGEVGEKNGHKVLHVKLFVNGKRVKGFKVEYGSAKSKKFKDALRNKLLDRLGVGSAEAAPSEGDGAGGDDVAEKPEKKKKKKKKKTDDESDASGDEAAASGDDSEDPTAEKAKGKGKGKKKTADGDDGESDGDGEGDGDGDGERTRDGEDQPEIETSLTRKANARGANRAAVRVDFGPSFSSRSLRFTSRNFEEAPKPYSNPLVPGGRLEGEIYPLAFSKPHSFIAGLGVGGEYDQTLKLNVQSTVQAGSKFPVTQKHLSVGGRIRIVFGHKPTSPSLTLAAGYTSRMFKVNRAGLMEGNIIDLPDVGYKGYNAGLGIRFPVIPAVALFAGGRGIFVTTTGAIQTSSQYGQAKVTGAEGQAGVDISIGSKMAVKVIGEFTQMGFAFTGTGQMSNNRDGDPTTKDVGGAADRYLGGVVTFGVMY